MPAQTVQGAAVYYVENDTAPPLSACLRDGAGNPIDLTNSEVRITAAFSLPHGSYYTVPRENIFIAAPVDIDPDQINNTGWVEFWPREEGDIDLETGDTLDKYDMSPPGEYLYSFEIRYPNGKRQTIPANTYLPLIVKTKPGGRGANTT